MKLFLASSLDKSISLLDSNFHIRGKKVLFIANAADNHVGDAWWVKADRDAFAKYNSTVVDIDLRLVDKEVFEKEINDSEIIHFCGGSVLYLISLIRKRGFDGVICKAVLENRIIYTGTSAGSMIVSSNVSLSAFDPEEQEYIGKEKITDFRGLGFVNFFVIPHSNNKDFIKANVEMVKALPEYKIPLIFICDSQTILVEGESIKILSV